MIINLRLFRLIITLFLFFLFPLIQKQWLNLYLFNLNNFSIYHLLYYLSGIICPILVIYNSLDKFTYLHFFKKDNDRHKSIYGGALLLFVLIVLFSLSLLIVNYLYINVNLILNILINKNYLLTNNFLPKIYITFFVSLFLIFKKTRIIIKKLVLFNFFIISSFIWYSQINNILPKDKILINDLVNPNNVNFFNIIILLGIEILYFLWSYLSYKNNLSDWQVPYPLKKEFTVILKIVAFYFCVIIYYSILE